MGFLDRLAKACASRKAPSECPRCKTPIEFPDAAHCPKCGEALLRCPECGGNWYIYKEGVHLCRICGAEW